MPVELLNAQRRVRLDTRRLKRQARSLLEAAGLERQFLSVLLTDDRRMAQAHERWMGEKGSTDVLSFAMNEGSRRKRQRQGVAQKGPPEVLGDIVISVETAARCRPKDVDGEAFRYLLHGLLHLMGHDHRSRAERLRMDRAGRRLTKGVTP